MDERERMSLILARRKARHRRHVETVVDQRADQMQGEVAANGVVSVRELFQSLHLRALVPCVARNRLPLGVADRLAVIERDRRLQIGGEQFVLVVAAYDQAIDVCACVLRSRSVFIASWTCA